MNNMNQMFAIVDIIMLAAGLYLMYAWYLLHFKNVIRLPVEEIGNIGYLLTQLIEGVAD